ncbi:MULTISPECIES: hypothetical protein [unclassified Novosphingobium]|uniref:hypothetical protein n=1 Tax=unclassified Novosphingobium TaxID=2644732 RepID=UPI001447CE91|nr:MULTISPECIES: hypothetical protein [unclassified Novosphingobium]NKJ45103.1 hypothetical protein [Novosphingobium sp. SG720]NMN06806.1 hypothetical protein [Novosphingobium sp. SG919]NMN88744.1 hypothetical protein [Novosphingobium sp. SG916]
MGERSEDYVGKLRLALVKAICEASVPEPDPTSGERGDTLYVGSAEVCDALIIVLAEFLEGVPGLDTPKDIRAMSDTVAKKVQRLIPEIRKIRARTGGAPPPSIIIRSH